MNQLFSQAGFISGRSLAMGRFRFVAGRRRRAGLLQGAVQPGDPGGGQYVHQHILSGLVLVDVDINRELPDMKVAYSNVGTTGQGKFSSYPERDFLKMVC